MLIFSTTTLCFNEFERKKFSNPNNELQRLTKLFTRNVMLQQ